MGNEHLYSAIEVFTDDAERRSFQYFRTRTSTQLSGYFVSDFWERLVPLAIHHEPAIKHAVIALASLHERYENCDDSILRSNQDVIGGGYALQQYIKAIHEVAKPSGSIKPKNGTVLVACILFACFEVRQTSLRYLNGSSTSPSQGEYQFELSEAEKKSMADYSLKPEHDLSVV